MDMPTSAATGLTLKDLFDAGLHFGHQTKRWNPKMKPYIFDKRNGIHIIDLTQTVTLIDEAAEFVRKTILDGKKILFVATKKQAQEIVKQAAEECGQYYMTERWLGGTLTNSQTIRGSVKRMCQLQAVAKANGGQLSVHKQEASMLRRELSKLEKNPQDRERGGAFRPRVLSSPCRGRTEAAGAVSQQDGAGGSALDKLFFRAVHSWVHELRVRKRETGRREGDEGRPESREARRAGGCGPHPPAGAQAAARVQLWAERAPGRGRSAPETRWQRWRGGSGVVFPL